VDDNENGVGNQVDVRAGGDACVEDGARNGQ
jgi:hypothetical protein